MLRLLPKADTGALFGTTMASMYLRVLADVSGNGSMFFLLHQSTKAVASA